MLVTKQSWVPLTSIVWAKNTMEVNGNQNSSLLNILKNNIFCSPQKKKIHDMKMSKLSFLDGLFHLKKVCISFFFSTRYYFDDCW